MPTTGAGAGQSGQPPKKRVQFINDTLVQTRRYEPNPAEWTAFDAQSQQPRRQMIRVGNNIRAEHAQKGKETAAAAAGWHLISVDGAVQHVEPGAKSISRAIEMQRCANIVGHFWQNRTSIPELEPLGDGNGATGADEWFRETMAIPLELVPAGDDDDEQMRPTAAAFVESAAGAADEVSGEDQPTESGTNHRSLDGGGNQCQQLLSNIRALLGVPKMSAEETANALERCGTKTPREICAEMLRMLEAPLGSEVSDSEHSKEKRPVDGEKAAAPAAANSPEINNDILHSSEAEEASEEATNLVGFTRREVEAVQQAEEEEKTHEHDPEADRGEKDDEEGEVEAVQQAEEEEKAHEDDTEEDQNGEEHDEEEEEVEAVQQAEEEEAEEEEEPHEHDAEEDQNGEDDDEDEEEEEESALPPGLFDDASSGEENAEQVEQKRASLKLPRPAIGFGLHPYRVGAARFDHQSRTEAFHKWKEDSATMTPLERWQKAKRGILHRVIM